MVVVELICIGGRIFLLKREGGTGRVFEGAKDTGSSASSVCIEGLRSRSLPLFGSYEPSPVTLSQYGVNETYVASFGSSKDVLGSYTFKVGS